MKDNKKSKMFLVPMSKYEIGLLKEAALYGAKNYIEAYAEEIEKQKVTEERDDDYLNYLYKRHKRFEKLYDRMIEITL